MFFTLPLAGLGSFKNSFLISCFPLTIKDQVRPHLSKGLWVT